MVVSTRFWRLAKSLLATIVVLIYLEPAAAAAAEDFTKLKQVMASFDECFIKSTYSFYYLDSLPPNSLDNHKLACKRQTEAFKCLRDQSRSAPALVRRGVASYVHNRSRFHKKYCTNPEGELARRLTREAGCIVDKRLAQAKANDASYINYLTEIERRNYNDSAAELRHLCCSTIEYKRAMIELAADECRQSRAMMEELMSSIIGGELELICDDEEKLLAKTCPGLDKIRVPKTPLKDLKPPAPTFLYLVATLGEPEPGRASTVMQ